MPQTLRATFSFQPHFPARRALLPVPSVAAFHSLEALLHAMQRFLDKAKSDLLQPRQQAVDRILRDAVAW